MSLPYTFANVTVLRTPEMDADNVALSNLGNIPCTATGTNTIALTPVAGKSATISAYSDLAPVFAFIAANSNSGATTINVSAVGAKNLYKNNGQTAVGSGDLISGALYLVNYNSSLNTGAGGFVLVNQGASGSSAGATQGGFKNLTVTNVTAGTPNTQVVITADAVAVSDGSSNYTTVQNVSLTINGLVNGANGLDTGALALNSWYYSYVIYNPTTLTTAGLLSLSATAPTKPSGYTQFARVGAHRTDGSVHFYYVLQKGRIAQYVVGTNPAQSLNIANGIAGTHSQTSPTLASLSVTTVVPTTVASRINVSVNNKYAAATISNVLVAPSTAWGGSNNGPSGGNGNVYPIALNAVANNFVNASAWIVLEATTIAWASDGTGGAVSCLGWEDNL